MINYINCNRRNFSTSLYSKSVHSHKELCCSENTPPHDNTFFVVFNHFSPVIRLWNNVQITCESCRSCYCVQFFYNGKSFIGYTKKLQKNHIDLSISSCDTICLLLTKSWAFSLYLNQFFSDIFLDFEHCNYCIVNTFHLIWCYLKWASYNFTQLFIVK